MDFQVSSFDKDGDFASKNAAAAAEEHSKWYGSGFLKHGRTSSGEDGFREFKVAKSSCGGEAQQMLSFSSPDSQHPETWPYLHHFPSRKATGYGAGGMAGAAMSGIRGPFTPSQWMELEHQALIYKYITANVPVPSALLIPIRKAFESAGFSAFPGVGPHSLGWGAFQLGYSSTDPEPGRCRRTDGKKWRCSRDAVTDQKYCERHMNRGRHRSRKPVEGQTGRSAAKAKVTPTSSAPPSAPAGVVAYSATHAHHQFSSLNPATILNSNRNVLNKDNENQCYIPEESNAYELVCSDSLINPSNRASFRQFMDERISCPEQDRTHHLSISTPMAPSSGFISPALSPTSADSPSRREFQATQMGLGVGMIHAEHNNQRHANWIPISWEPSLGGPLGEALHAVNNCSVECSSNAKALNLIDMWDECPGAAAASPDAVLQKGAMGSLSNSSAGSSPRAGLSSRTHDGTGLCNGLILMPGQI